MKKLLKISLSLIITVIFVTGIIMPEIIMGTPASTAVGNWYQQFLPSLNGRQITDITFLDSLTGFAVTNNITQNDTGFILKTTNGGNNWNFKFNDLRYLTKVKFINSTTGFVTGGAGDGAKIYKSTNAGENWNTLNIPGGGQLSFEDISVLSNDTLWVVSSTNPIGGVFRTTNGGTVWEQQGNFGSSNPSHIYMYNARIGFIDGGGLRKTTNSGENWISISGAGNFLDMFFIDSLTGWKINLDMKKTTDGGMNWVTQVLPFGGNILGNGANRFMNKDNDTIWATGETIITGGSPPTRGILFRTTNGGINWLFQIPDTAIHINRYLFGQFINNRIGWAYSFNPTGIHTTNGADPVWLTDIEQISGTVPEKYRLMQNYPNPFNPSTIIRYMLSTTSDVNLTMYNIQGKLITEIVNQKQAAGTYEVDFDGSKYSSGVYFYSLIIGGAVAGVKKMILIK